MSDLMSDLLMLLVYIFGASAFLFILVMSGLFKQLKRIADALERKEDK